MPRYRGVATLEVGDLGAWVCSFLLLLGFVGPDIVTLAL